ncbi:hypothetical protein BCR44DRAFT_1426799 [Catenaria anguillulae PL171]|uniref:Uncharacterized protein n=1 Tax=Catenaria anguillulae PL171 TaxID=765915 RepID=A0A1Y2I2D3_9FUNG|nr:hypothetical protein BCR44DRAFT_1426799 [Catenaria anguillulae PL171]
MRLTDLSHSAACLSLLCSQPVSSPRPCLHHTVRSTFATFVSSPISPVRRRSPTFPYPQVGCKQPLNSSFPFAFAEIPLRSSGHLDFSCSFVLALVSLIRFLSTRSRPMPRIVEAFHSLPVTLHGCEGRTQGRTCP